MEHAPMFKRTNLIAMTLVAAGAVALTGCGPTKAGKEARSQAYDRMNLINAQVHYDQARQSFESGQFDKALREINRAIARFSEAPPYYVIQGRIYLETHQLEAALDSLNKAVELGEPKDEKSSIQPPVHVTDSQQEKLNTEKKETLAQAHYFAGIVFQRWSDDEQAYRRYLKAFEIQPTNAQYLLASAESLIALGEFEMAKQLVQPKMAYFEHNAALRQLQGQIALLQGDPKQAAALYSEARLLNPDDSALLEQMMWAQYAAGMYGQCHESVKRLQQQERESAGRGGQAGVRSDLIHLEARCLNMMGRGPEARELYIELTKLRPADPVAWTELGSLAWDLGDYRRVAMCSVQIIALAPDRYEGYMFKGINERHRGNLDEAVKLFRESSQLATDIALPHLLLGQTLEQSGQVTQAQEAYAQAMKIEPNSVEARELLRRLAEHQRLSAASSD